MAKLSKVVIAPSKHLSFSCEHTREKVTTDYLYNWDIEINHVGDRSDIFKLHDILSRDLVALNLLSVFGHCRDTAHDYKRILGLIIDAMEQSVDIAWSHVINDSIKHVMPDSLPHRAVLVE